jgi:hypothetical protein
VISLLKVQAPAVGLERRIQNELERMGASNVSVRRLSQGAAPDDQEDVFVLEGSIRTCWARRTPCTSPRGCSRARRTSATSA